MGWVVGECMCVCLRMCGVCMCMWMRGGCAAVLKGGRVAMSHCRRVRLSVHHHHHHTSSSTHTTPAHAHLLRVVGALAQHKLQQQAVVLVHLHTTGARRAQRGSRMAGQARHGCQGQHRDEAGRGGAGQGAAGLGGTA